MNLLPQAILFVNVDNRIISYHYRKPHFVAARKKGLKYLIATPKQADLDHLREDCDALFPVEEISQDALLRLVENIKQRFNLRAIFCCAGHASPIAEVGSVVAQVCKELGIYYSPATAISSCNNKFLMRKYLQEQGIQSSAFALCHNSNQLIQEAERIGYPILFKPPISAASSFVKKCQNKNDLLSHYELFTTSYHESNTAIFYPSAHDIILNHQSIARFSPGETVLLEEYIDGREGTVECVVHDGKVYPLLINEKLILTEKRNTILENLLICPSYSYSDSEIESIKHYAIGCIQALGLKNDIVHLEFRLTDEGPRIIEINPRIGGLYVDAAFQDITGIDPYELYIEMLLKEDDRVSSKISGAITKLHTCKQYFSMMVIYPETSGKFRGFNNTDYIKKHPDILQYMFYPPGGYVNADIEENYLLKCWVKVQNSEHALSIYRDLVQKVTPIITN